MSNLAFKLNNSKPVENGNFSTLEELLENIFLNCSNQILGSYYLLHHHYDAEALHKYRVSMRRFKAFIDFFKFEINDNERIAVLKIIKMLFDSTSKARDFDVAKEDYISPSFDNNFGENEFKTLNEHSEKEQTKLHKNTLNELTSGDYLNALDELKIWINNKKWKDELTKDQHKILNKKPDKLVKKRIKKYHHNIMHNKKDVLLYSQKKLHKLRANIKELRYVIDDLGFFINHNKYELEFLKNLQDLLGKINDTYIAKQVVNDLGKYLEIGVSRTYIQDQADSRRNKYLLELENINK